MLVCLVSARSDPDGYRGAPMAKRQYGRLEFRCKTAKQAYRLWRFLSLGVELGLLPKIENAAQRQGLRHRLVGAARGVTKHRNRPCEASRGPGRANEIRGRGAARAAAAAVAE